MPTESFVQMPFAYIAINQLFNCLYLARKSAKKIYERDAYRDTEEGINNAKYQSV